MEQVTVAGHYIAYSRYADGGGQYYRRFTLRVRDALTRRVLLSSQRGEIGVLHARVLDIVVDRRGHAAWLWQAMRDSDLTVTREIRRGSGCGPEVLDSGSHVGARLLSLRHGILSWHSAGTTRTAAFCPATPSSSGQGA